MNGKADTSGVRELDRRSGNGIDVTLLWSSRSGRVIVAVEDARTSESFHITVDPHDALDAFNHPYAYGSRRGRRATQRVRLTASPKA
jgi:hypothetical protein